MKWWVIRLVDGWGQFHYQVMASAGVPKNWVAGPYPTSERAQKDRWPGRPRVESLPMAPHGAPGRRAKGRNSRLDSALESC